MFNMCNQSSCMVTTCTANFNTLVVLDLRILFINSISMAMGPSPNLIELAKMEDGTSTVTRVMTCQDLGLDRPPCTIHASEDGFEFAGSFPNNITFIITSIDSSSRGTYIATASFTDPATNVRRTLTKTFTGKH